MQTHLAHIFAKLGVSTRAQLAAQAPTSTPGDRRRHLPGRPRLHDQRRQPQSG